MVKEFTKGRGNFGVSSNVNPFVSNSSSGQLDNICVLWILSKSCHRTISIRIMILHRTNNNSPTGSVCLTTTWPTQPNAVPT